MESTVNTISELFSIIKMLEDQLMAAKKEEMELKKSKDFIKYKEILERKKLQLSISESLEEWKKLLHEKSTFQTDELLTFLCEMYNQEEQDNPYAIISNYIVSPLDENKIILSQGHTFYTILTTQEDKEKLLSDMMFSQSMLELRIRLSDENAIILPSNQLISILNFNGVMKEFKNHESELLPVFEHLVDLRIRNAEWDNSKVFMEALKDLKQIQYVKKNHD